MSKTVKNPLPSPLPQAGEGADLDEHHGKGGSYVKDPITGLRVLQERTQGANASATETKE